MTSSRKKTGKTIIPLGVYPETHELETAAVFLAIGYDVEFIKPSDTQKLRSADVVIDGIEWEVKSPTGKSRYTIQNQFKRAARQSKNLILDSRRVRLSNDFVRQEVSKQFMLRKSIVRIKLILKSGEIIDFKKR